MKKASNIFFDMIWVFLSTIIIILFFILIFYSPFTIEMLANTFPNTECENCIVVTYFMYVMITSILVHLLIEIYKDFNNKIKKINLRSKLKYYLLDDWKNKLKSVGIILLTSLGIGLIMIILNLTIDPIYIFGMYFAMPLIILYVGTLLSKIENTPTKQKIIKLEKDIKELKDKVFKTK